MKIIKWLFIILLFSQINCIKNKNEYKFERLNIDHVKIYNENFEIIKIIDKEIDLDNFCEYFDKIEKSELPEVLNWEYKIDIESKNKHDNGRWLYDKKGYIAKLNYQLEPCYKLYKFKDFNYFFSKD